MKTFIKMDLKTSESIFNRETGQESCPICKKVLLDGVTFMEHKAVAHPPRFLRFKVKLLEKVPGTFKPVDSVLPTEQPLVASGDKTEQVIEPQRGLSGRAQIINPKKQRVAGYGRVQYSEGRLSHVTTFLCKDCDFVVCTKRGLSAHRVIHRRRLNGHLVCQLCDLTFTYPKSMQTHLMKRHKSDMVVESIPRHAPRRILPKPPAPEDILYITKV